MACGQWHCVCSGFQRPGAFAACNGTLAQLVGAASQSVGARCGGSVFEAHGAGCADWRGGAGGGILAGNTGQPRRSQI